jgi:nucleotide-binding universal stress UspA family protein
MFKKMILGTDGSAHALKAAAVAKSLLDEDKGRTLLVVHSVNIAPLLMGEEVEEMPIDIISKALDDAGERALKVTMEVFAGLGDRVKAVLEQGDPAHVIVDRAREDGIDLLIVGSQGLSGVSRLLMGSVSSKIVQLAECSVLVVR